MPWLKITDHWASGHSSVDYTYVHDEDRISEAVTEAREKTNNENDWSDKYRGCQVEEIPCPPVEWLEVEIKKTRGRVESLTRYHEILIGFKEKANEP